MYLPQLPNQKYLTRPGLARELDDLVVDPLDWTTSRAFDVAQRPPHDDIPAVVYEASMSTKLTDPVEYKPKIVGTGSKVTGWDGQDDPNFQFFPGEFYTMNGGAQDLHLVGAIKPGGGSQAAGWPIVFTFDTDSPVVELSTYGTTNGWGLLIEVNGRLVDDTLFNASNLGSSATCTLTFPDTGATRRIRIWGGHFPGISAVRVLTGKTVTKPAEQGRLGAIIGDSFVNGSGTSTKYPDQGTSLLETFAPRLLRMMGFDRMALAGIGGTGWTTTNPYSERVPMVAGFNPDLLIFYGSRNDGQGAGTIQATVESTLAAVPAGVPLLVIPPNRQSYEANYQAVLAGAKSSGVEVVDWPGIFRGTGNVSAPTGDGNNDFFRMADGVHPTLDGHRALARTLYGHVAH